MCDMMLSKTNSSLLLCFFIAFSLFGQTFRHAELEAKLLNLKNTMGVAVADFDLDNDLDIFVVAKYDFNASDVTTWSRLFKNNNDGTFEDVTLAAGFGQLYNYNALDLGWEYGVKTGVAWGDYDNDGFPDLCLTSFRHVQLFHNQGDGTFQEVSEAAGFPISDICYNMSPLWWDFDKDGLLDLYISKWGLCLKNRLYKNNGNGTFTEVGEQTGTGGTIIARTWMAVPFDFNGDSQQDLYLANDITKNELFIRQNDSLFTENAADYGLDFQGNYASLALGDYNNDGFFDLFAANIDKNKLLTQSSNRTFIDLALEKNVLNTHWSWASKFADFDLDGDEDLFVSNGYQKDTLATPADKTNFLFKNLHREGQDSFQDWSATAKVDEVSNSMCAEVFDYDNDGDLDVCVSNMDAALFFYENESIDQQINPNQHWCKIELEGTLSNRNGLGSRVSIFANGLSQHRFYHGAGLLAQSLQAVHFGLADATKIDSLTIIWPLGLKETFYDLPIDKTIRLKEKEGLTVHTFTAQKVYGCTDSTSCTYNPLATVDDGSCSYRPAPQISGETTVGFLQTKSYTCSGNPNASYQWSVKNGEIVEGQGSRTVRVLWALEDSASISVRETTNCASETAALSVDLNGKNLDSKHSVARLWNEALLFAIRNDFARPTVHARNLWHTSIAMYDAWAVYDDEAQTYLLGKTVKYFTSDFEGFTPNEAVETARQQTISYAAYRLLSHRFAHSPGRAKSQAIFDLLMDELGYDRNEVSMDYGSGSGAALGNYIAETLIELGLQDGSNEQDDYRNGFYFTLNPPLLVDFSGNPSILDLNRWQPLTLETFIDQSGFVVPENTPEFLSPEWGNVLPFAMDDDELTYKERDGFIYRVYEDPGAPPKLSLSAKTEEGAQYQWNFSLVSVWSSHLDASDGVFWDVSPKGIGNIPFDKLPTEIADYPEFYNLTEGGDISQGWLTNPISGEPYVSQIVPRGDYTRVLAEFWADGPDSETPPGHWFTILNHVNDHPLLAKKLAGKGAALDPLEWDVKSYFILGGTMHDAAIAAWSIKGWYDYIRPVSAIRAMAEKGQSTGPTLPNYNVAGFPLMPSYIEMVEAGDPLAGQNGEHVGKVKLYAWKGHRFITDTDKDIAGVGWILAEDWVPYQRPSFVTPPFAGYVSGHSTYSRAAAEAMTALTGDNYFPGGVGEFVARKNEFLVFEEGPSQDVILQWATYQDASDQCSLSRIWGGIHPPADDIRGRLIGERIGKRAFARAVPYFSTPKTGQAAADIVLYPNPSRPSGEITLTNTAGDMDFKLYNAQGQLMSISSTEFNPYFKCTTLHINHLAAGVYVISAAGRSWKLVVQ